MIPVVIITWYRAQSSALSLHHWYLLNVFTNTYIILLVTSLKQNDGVRASHTTSSLQFDPWWRHTTPAAFLWSLTWWVTHLKNRCYTWWWYARLISGWLARICMGTAKIHKIRFSVEWPLRAWDDCCSEIPTLPANIVESWNLRPPGLVRELSYWQIPHSPRGVQTDLAEGILQNWFDIEWVLGQKFDLPQQVYCDGYEPPLLRSWAVCFGTCQWLWWPGRIGRRGRYGWLGMDCGCGWPAPQQMLLGAGMREGLGRRERSIPCCESAC